ncbi:SdrD B-like domain-containing protein [Geomonas paludis]|uniref:Uncharacterized protein n=1 Tax=Geomonas paludis TaxID=2740185 RepID=A0A6V8N0V6_9BACT|nr:SdrD B-like domain-containing protein [Geomonas paludis]GFO66105.1 hypothetical protein GMPD_40240 [Geomonas paludis]
MSRMLRNGPENRGAFGAPRRGAWLQWAPGIFALALVLACSSSDQSFAWVIPHACIKAEKSVSTTGLGGPFIRNSVTTTNPDGTLTTSVPGANNVPAPTVKVPTAFYGDTKVVYKFLVKNCGEVMLYNVRLGDCIDTRSVGSDGFLLGASDNKCVWDPLLVPSTTSIAQSLSPTQSVTLTSASFPLNPISSVDICGTFGRSRTNGIVRNDLVIKADADLDGDGVGEKTIVFEDLNLVQCKDFQHAYASVGDRVWRDLNGNGVQDCLDSNNNGIIGDAGDTGTECGAGIPGVTVNLVDCQNPTSVVSSMQTDPNGFYLFQNLNPGRYCVRFDAETVPPVTCATGVPQFTTQNVGGNDSFDSDASPITGVAPAVTLVSGQTDRTVDAGVICKACQVAIDKKCQVQPPATGSFVCSNAKPIDSLTMIWTGQDGIYIKAWKGTPGTTLLATTGPIAKGEKVTVTGMGGSPLDQIWEIFSGLPDPQGSNKIGQSQFHISCSDIDMNGPEDCGKLAGNAKTTNTALLNLWIFDGMAGNGEALSCTPSTQSGQDACSFVAEAAPSCLSLRAKPQTLTFRYTGKDCGASSNSQAADKWSCSGIPGSSPLISIVKDPTRITVSPTSGLSVGDLLTVSTIGTDMGTEIQLQVGGQAIKVHTSCSQPLAVGDIFGSLELLQFNGRGAGAQVTYSYQVKNNGSAAVDITSVSDDKLGELLGQTTRLEAGGTLALEKTALVTQTTTNQVTATARVAGSGTICNQVRDLVTVTMTSPTCAVGASFYGLGDYSVKYKLTNASATMATLDTMMLNFPGSYGSIKEIRLDGTIYKYAAGGAVVGPGVKIGASVWTNPDITKRQLNPGETRVLEVIFSKKGVRSDWLGITSFGGMTFKEGCQATFPVTR